MTINEFYNWWEGFTAALGGQTPTDAQWRLLCDIISSMKPKNPFGIMPAIFPNVENNITVGDPAIPYTPKWVPSSRTKPLYQ